MKADDWLTAFLLTQAFEMPIYWLASRARPWTSRLAYAFGASAITHPILWFCLPWQTAPYLSLLITAEIGVVIVEGAWGKLWQVPRPWITAFIANLTSVILGNVVRWMCL